MSANKSLFLLLSFGLMACSAGTGQITPKPKEMVPLTPASAVPSPAAEALKPAPAAAQAAPSAVPVSAAPVSAVPSAPAPVHQVRIQGKVQGYKAADKVVVFIETHSPEHHQEWIRKINSDGSYDVTLTLDRPLVKTWIKAHEKNDEDHRSSPMIALPEGKAAEAGLTGVDLNFDTPFPDDMPLLGSEISIVEKTEIHGYVYTPDHRPLAGVRLNFRSMNDAVPFRSESVTDEQGWYQIANAPSGVQVEMVASKPGFIEQRRVEVMKSCGGGEPERNAYHWGNTGASGLEDKALREAAYAMVPLSGL